MFPVLMIRFRACLHETDVILLESSARMGLIFLQVGDGFTGVAILALARMMVHLELILVAPRSWLVLPES